MKHTKKKLIAAITAVAFGLPMVQPSITTYACSTVEECQTQLETLQAENEQAQKKLESSQSIFSTTQERVDNAQALANSIQAEIDAYQATIDSLVQQTVELEAKIVELEASIEEKQTILRERLVDMQLRVKTNQLLEFIVNSDSLTDLLSRAQSIQQLNEYDYTLIKEIEAQQAEVEAHKAVIVQAKQEAESLRNQAVERQNAQAEVIATLQAERQALAQEILGTQGIVDSLSLSAEDIAAQMAILESYAALQNQTPEDTSSSQPSQDGSNEIPQASGFYRPTSGVMTLPYMSTEYPYSAARPHLGVDYGAAEGTPVVAVTDGVVIQASYGDNGGYGNMIVISHNVNGTPMVSIYGHLSSISVSAGQTISGGEYIGAVGNTGQSFGAHLHIELLVGINYMPAGREERQSYTVNPAIYF
ncbi:MAG: murein hydrolase activator EnvC family protein [Culicoidibacterales bacterium]